MKVVVGPVESVSVPPPDTLQPMVAAMGAPYWSSAVAVRAWSAPGAMVGLDGLTLMVVSTGGACTVRDTS